ncbi:unnamed protein product [Cuscuta epithymum]|uniref:Late embryogenesis abundant protein LEA-2 subgroup domain-containing protein n=1 Tax=Cuscuta epithymum TaxID=186058 RepID=A0AAV0C5N2_9ASTE|nr:unnamed protein product [Cuscuta epithymum]
MADKVFPASRPASNGTAPGAANGGGANQSFPPKAQPYNPARPVYRPQQQPRRHRRGCCCRCCLWTTFLIAVLLILAAIVGAAFWVLYHPQRPTFAVNSLRFSQFNLTSSTISSKLEISISARNPNRKVIYIYDPATISAISDEIDLGSGSIRGFEHGTKNTTVLKATIASSRKTLDGRDLKKLKSKKSLPLTVRLDTKVRVKVGSLKTKKVGVRVTCGGIRVNVPSGKSPSRATSADVKCQANIRVKIWKWTF